MEIKLQEGATESEKAFVKGLSEALTKAFNEAKEDGQKAMQEALVKFANENNISKEETEKMAAALKAQGEALKALKENPAQRKVNGLKSAFFEKYDEFVKALKSRQAGFEVKAVSEHTDGNIQTTTSSVTLNGGAIGAEMIGENPNVFMKRKGRQYIHDIANVTVVDNVPEVFTFWEEGDENGTFANVAENAVKPQINHKLIKNQVSAEKIAGYITVTEEVLKWRQRLWAQIQRLFSDKLWRDYEKALTTSLIAKAASYANAAFDDIKAAPTDLDAIIAAVAQLEALNFQPDVLIINPNDKWKLALSEKTNGTLILPYIQQGGNFGLLGLRVITTTEMTAGTFMVGESGTWFIEEEMPTLRTGLVNDDLIHNRYTIVGELFYLSYIPSNHTGSFVKATFTEVKEAMKAGA